MNAHDKVKRINYGTVHHVAICKNCNWDDGAGGDRTVAAVTAAAKRHVKSTGHSVNVESGTSATYEAN